MKLIVGLGNPGKEYENTRHNIGFRVIDSFANSHGILINNMKYDGLYNTFFLNNEKIILLKPQLYMNLSGEVVERYIKYFKINVEDILIVSDDLDLDYLKIKLKYQGSCGGHNGLRNIEDHIKTQKYKRLKIGISNNKNVNTKDYVLGKLNNDELLQLNHLLVKTNELLNDYFSLDFEVLMSKYN